MAHDDEAHLDDRMLHRLMFFTDAVFAIVLTLLVLELKPPESRHEATAETLRQMAPHIGAFVFSFVLISIFWVAHMNTTRRLVRFDWPTALANLLFLLPVCLLPFATAWFGADFSGAVAWELYCWTLVAISAANIVMVLTAYRGGGKLIAGGSPPGERLYRVARAGAPGIAFAAGLAGLAAGQVIPAHFCCALIPVVFWSAEWFLKPKPSATKAA